MNELPERILEEPKITLRPISEGGEKWLYRPIKCLDHGFIYLVDYMGNDDAVIQAARVSYGSGTQKVSTQEGLIRYLRRNVHTTPSEMVELKFHCKMPIFVARQWIRHRMANVNEYSGRYSEMLDEFYLPDMEVLKKQSIDNKQGRNENLDPKIQAHVIELLKAEYEGQYATYRELLKVDLARELARIGLSVANYTQWYWKIDLHNLFHFLRLRLDEHAQYEIRIYAQAMAGIIKDLAPISFKAFEDYQLYAITFSKLELDILSSHGWPMEEPKAIEAVKLIENKRERGEFLDKLSKIKFII